MPFVLRALLASYFSLLEEVLSELPHLALACEHHGHLGVGGDFVEPAAELGESGQDAIAALGHLCKE